MTQMETAVEAQVFDPTTPRADTLGNFGLVVVRRPDEEFILSTLESVREKFGEYVSQYRSPENIGLFLFYKQEIRRQDPLADIPYSKAAEALVDTVPSLATLVNVITDHEPERHIQRSTARWKKWAGIDFVQGSRVAAANERSRCVTTLEGLSEAGARLHWRPWLPRIEFVELRSSTPTSVRDSISRLFTQIAPRGTCLPLARAEICATLTQARKDHLTKDTKDTTII